MSSYKLDSRASSDAVGLNIRPEYIAEILAERPDLSFIEVIAENLISDNSLLYDELSRIREHYPISLHCLGMSLGSTDELDYRYLDSIRKISEELSVTWISDHLAWTSVHGVHFHDLLPLPYTWETVQYVASRIARIQDFLGRRILIENISCYLNFKDADMSEAEFISAIAEQADCRILLDVSNIYVNSVNQGMDIDSFLARIPQTRIQEIHLGGFEPRGEYILDSHGSEIADVVWNLYKVVIARFGPIPTVIERDNNLPALQNLVEEAYRARKVMQVQAEVCVNA